VCIFVWMSVDAGALVSQILIHYITFTSKIARCYSIHHAVSPTKDRSQSASTDARAAGVDIDQI
jgi:hypothetical protein